jgi:hypothetical protein
MRKILFNRPWLLVVGFFCAFVALWMSFIVFAVKRQPIKVPMEQLDGKRHVDH